MSVNHEYDVIARRRTSAEAIPQQNLPEVAYESGDCFASLAMTHETCDLLNVVSEVSLRMQETGDAAKPLVFEILFMVVLAILFDLLIITLPP